MMKTAKLTKAETARLLRAVHQIARRAGHDYTQSGAIGMITTLTDLLDGVRYDLCNAEDDTIRKATVAETVDSVMATRGWITVDNVPCYVDC